MLDSFCIPVSFSWTFFLGWSSVTWKWFDCFQVLLLCSLDIFWSSAQFRANYSPSLRQDPTEYTLYPVPHELNFQSGCWEQALFLVLSVPSNPPFRWFIPQARGCTDQHPTVYWRGPSAELWGSLFVQLCVLWFSLLRNVADLVPRPSPFSFQLRESARLHLSFPSLNHALENTWRQVNWGNCRTHPTYFQCPSLLVSSALKIVVSYILSVFFCCCLFICFKWKGKSNPFLHPPWPEAEIGSYYYSTIYSKYLLGTCLHEALHLVLGIHWWINNNGPWPQGESVLWGSTCVERQ